MKRKLIAVASITALLCIVLGNSIACTPTTQYDLTISSTSGGNVTEPGEGIFPCNAGTVVTLVATPDAGYHFVEWTGDVGDAHVEDATTNITMNDDYTITANFALEIRDWYDLYAISNNLSGSYLLMNDLDSTTAGYAELASETANGGKGWQPIGTFSGTFDGQGYEIIDLFINRPDEIWVGLFWANNGGGIEDIGMVNANVTGNNCTSGLVGSNSGTVSNSYSTSSVTGNYYVGGLVARNWGTVSNSYSTSSVTGNYVGGLVGINQGTVSNSYSTGNVTGNHCIGGLVGWNRNGNVTNSSSTGSVTGNNYIGGLVGMNDYGTVSNSYSTGNVSGGYQGVGGLMGMNHYGTVNNSYSTGSVTGNNYTTGGLIGENMGNVSNSYSTGSVTGNQLVGGLVGQNWAGTVSNSYSSGNVTGNTHTGGLVGYNYATVSNSYSTGNVSGGHLHVGGLVGGSSGTVSNSYWDTETSGQLNSGGGIGKTTAQMQDIDTFSDAGWDIVLIGDHVDETWYINNGNDYPRLGWQL